MKRLENKVAIITGAANGIGKETAILFAKHGARAVVTDIDEKNLNQTMETIKADGGVAIAMKHDVSLEEDWAKVISTTEKKFGRLHILVNNAAKGGNRKGIAESSLEQFETTQAINTRGVFLGIKFGAALMKKSNGGSIINIASVYGLVGSPGSIAYHASKGAVKLMTKSAAIELGKDFIRANCIHPALIETAMLRADNGRHPYQEKIPLSRLGKPIDIAYGALYLASEESRFVTGSDLVIDGGYTAQ